MQQSGGGASSSSDGSALTPQSPPARPDNPPPRANSSPGSAPRVSGVGAGGGGGAPPPPALALADALQKPSPTKRLEPPSQPGSKPPQERAKSMQEMTTETLLKEISASGEHSRGLGQQIGDASTQAFADKTESVEMRLAGLQAAQVSRAGRATARAPRAKGRAARGRASRGPASACIGEARRPPRGRRALAEQPAPGDRRQLGLLHASARRPLPVPDALQAARRQAAMRAAPLPRPRGCVPARRRGLSAYVCHALCWVFTSLARYTHNA